MEDSKNVVLDIVFGRWRSQILHAGVRLGMFDAIGEGEKNAADIAGELGLDSALSYRLLRALGAIGMLKESPGRRFAVSPSGALLQSDHPETLRGVVLLEEGPEHYRLWQHLCDMVRDGKQNAFVREFDAMAFDFAAQNEDYSKVFNQAMSSYSNAQTGWALEALTEYDFSSIGSLCDIGGGHGHLLCHFLKKYSHLSGTVLEQPSVVANEELLWAGPLGVADRCQFQGGNMFHEAPAADAFMMKMILHDWNDEECVQILKHCHQSATEGGRVFVIEHIVPGPEQAHFSKLFDIHMMCWGTGQERTEEEYRALLDASGWQPVKTHFPESGMMGVVEGVKR